MKRTLITLAVTAMAATPMFAANSASAPLNISANVDVRCTITTSPVGFGAYDTLAGTAVPGTGSVNVACTKGATGLSIDLSTGANPAAVAGNTRAMANSGSFLGYDLYTDSAHTSVWSTGVGISDSTDKNSRAITVYGLIAASQDVPAGSYTDTVTAKINY